MSTIVSFHAHPDDEAILCGGTLAKAAAAGHRVVLRPRSVRQAFGAEWFRRAATDGQEDHTRPAAVATDLFTDSVA